MGRLVFALVLCCGAVRADVFLLADGSRIEGTATESGDTVVISAFDGRTVRVSKKDIRGSVPDPKRNTYFARFKALKDGDAAARVELAKFCESNRLKAEADALYHAALKIDPANAVAGAALGYELREGKWQPKEETFVIGARSVAPPPTVKTLATPAHIAPLAELPKEPQQAWRVRLSRTSIDGELPPSSPEVAQMISDAKENPTYVLKLLVPPQFPGSLPQISPDVRLRAARGWAEG